MAEEWNSSFNLNSHDEEKSFSPIFFQKTPLTDVYVDKIKWITLKYINKKKNFDSYLQIITEEQVFIYFSVPNFKS